MWCFRVSTLVGLISTLWGWSSTEQGRVVHWPTTGSGHLSSGHPQGNDGTGVRFDAWAKPVEHGPAHSAVSDDDAKPGLRTFGRGRGWRAASGRGARGGHPEDLGADPGSRSAGGGGRTAPSRRRPG